MCSAMAWKRSWGKMGKVCGCVRRMKEEEDYFRAHETHCCLHAYSAKALTEILGQEDVVGVHEGRVEY